MRNSVVLAILVLGLVAMNLLVSANYVLNEFPDAPFDLNHPEKWKRPASMGHVSGRLVLI
jgi:decaprenyl-phosphate phosphoribosyltransferase